MQFSEFSQYLQKLEGTPSRLEMTAILAELFAKLHGVEEVQKASYLLEGRLVPQYESLEFQLSVKMLLRALSRIFSTTTQSPRGETTSLFGEVDFSHAETHVQQLYKTLGDIGLATAAVVQDSVEQSPSTMTIGQVYDALFEIAQENGDGSQERKVQRVIDLLQQLDSSSAKFVSRIIVGSLRLGFSTMTLLDGLSWSRTGGKSESSLLEMAYQKKADIGKLAAAYLTPADQEERQKALEQYTVEVGVPVAPQLCQILGSSQEVIEKMTEVMAEAKYDGLRVQIHISKKGIGQSGLSYKVFTRNMEDATHMFPELERLVEHIGADNVILDGEAIGYDPKTGGLLPFQATITRKRKHDIELTAQNIPLKFFIFDLIACNDESLLVTPLRERKDRLNVILDDTEQFIKTSYITTKDPKELQTFHELQLAEGLEGVVIKQIDSPYQSGRKGWYWVKMKHAEGEHGKLSDTLDCIIMGYYLGRGKRASFGVGAFLVGVLTTEKTIVTIAKIGTGISEEQLTVLKASCDRLQSKTIPVGYQVPKVLFPDVWVQPQLVAEIAADEVTRSPLHTAGVALRFPRLITMREDKNWEDATSVSEVEKIVAASNPGAV